MRTAPDNKTLSALIEGLGVGGQLLVVWASTDPISMAPVQFILSR